MITTDSFFERPRSWSLIKYKILDKYLSAYFPKVNQQYYTKAIIADLFAGRGKFEDGTEGSPIIIAKHARTYRQKLGYDNKVILSETIDEDRQQLTVNMQEFINEGIVEIIPGNALNVGSYLLNTIPPKIPLFIFLDPFGIKGLSMDLLLQVFNRAKNGSTELLINFNHRAIPRLAGICRNLQSKDRSIQRQAETIKKIVNDSLGGEWWLEIMHSNSLKDDEKPKIIQDKYLDYFRNNFNWIGTIPVTIGLAGEDVKYHLIFASQSQIAMELMNDVMANTRRALILDEIRNQNKDTLFQNNDPDQFLKKDLKVDIERLSNIILDEAKLIANRRSSGNNNQFDVIFKRPELRARLLKLQFARFTKSDYNEAIKRLLEKGQIISENNRIQISDEKALKLIKIK